ncbi:MAG: ABC transporter permease [Pseudomonadales bacterium]|nr:ABC transporter permease [Pseudomonadales bacterium]
MFKSYVAISLRNLWKHKSLSAINIFGLAIGLVASLLILIYVQFELSYDRYNVNLDRIYRITIAAALGGDEIEASTSPYPMAAALRNEYPEIETATRFRPYYQDPLVARDDISYQESEVFHADQQFFDIFTVGLLAGDIETALNRPFTLVITESIAEKYFERSDVVGETLRFNNEQDFEITAVIEDIPAASHFHPDILVSFTSDSQHDSQMWINNNINTYLLIREGVSSAELEPKLQDLVQKYVAPQIEEGIGASYEDFLAGGGRWGYRLFPVADIHLNSQLEGEIEPPGSITYVYTFQAVAVFILALACINFMNLSTARSSNRAKEIGVRKVVGAMQDQLVSQFLLESVLTSLIALGIALPLLVVLLPSFNAITDRDLGLDLLLSLPSAISLLGAAVLVGIIAGTYPALFLSRFSPQAVLKGSSNMSGRNYWIRSSLVVLQFAISVALIAATMIVFSQMEYVRNKDLGWDKEQIIVVERANALGDQLETFKTQLSQHPGIVNISSSSHLPGDGGDINAFIVEGRPFSETTALNRLTVNYDYIETMGIEILQGRSFSRDITSEHPGYILNQAAVQELQLTDPLSSALGETDTDGIISGRVIGVVNDFHFMSLHQPIAPMVMRIDDFTRFVVVRASPGSLSEVISALEDNWRIMTNNEPFSYHLLDEEFEALHSGEQQVGNLFLGFSTLAIVIACLGLYGLASFATSQRTKEIGIRKTLGASVTNIVLMIGKEFLVLVIIAICVAVPVAYLFMSRWLEVFAYRIEIGPEIFLLSGVTAIVIAFLTVSYQSVIAATTNPVHSLRDE